MDAQPIIDSTMGTKEWLELVGFALVVLGWAVSIIRSLLHRDRDSIDKAGTELSRQVEALWKSHDEIETKYSDMRKDIAVIDDRLKNIPAADRWDAKLDAVRSGLDLKMDRVLRELNKAQIQLAIISHRPISDEQDSQS
jgi:hypothetical protein